VYLDDVLIFSKTLAEHKGHVEGVLQALQNARLRSSEPKCVVGILETSFVEFRVNRHGIHMEEKKIKAVCNWPIPKTPTELWGFLGLAGYSRKFVRKSAHQAHLPHNLAAKPKNEFIWTRQHEDQFEDLKQALMSASVLATLDPDANFILWSDALDTAIGGVLAQKQLFDGRLVERPRGYFSRKLHAVQTRYPTYHRELHAISANLEHWACYVHGRRRTTIFTNHPALQHILWQNKLTSREWHYLDKLQQHDYEVKYYPGAANVVAYALSRIASAQEEHPKSAPMHLNGVELRISASTEWLDDVRNSFKEDAIFGPVVYYLSNPSEKDDKNTDMKQRWHIKERAKSYTLEEGPSGGNLFIPKFLRSDVICEAHDAILGGGHIGTAKTAVALGSRYHWPKMTNSIAEWITRCDICHHVNHKNTRPYGLLQALPIPLERAERVNIDFVMKLPTSEAGYDAVTTIIDPLKKRTWWIPVKKAELTAEKFATVFING